MRGIGRSYRTALALCCLAIGAFGAAGAQAANTQLKEEFAPFLDCPLASAGLCAVSKTVGGEFKIGNKTVPITQTITLQGGLKENAIAAQPLIGARDGNTLSKTALKVPGGLTGIELLGGELTATAEIAGSPSDILINQVYLAQGAYTAVVLPLKIKLGNPVLGDDCYIGSDAHPILLNLTDGTTNPPPPAHPISGSKGTLETVGKKKIIRISANKLVDNSFAVPAATGCGTNPLLVPLITGLVNLDAGLPSAAGHNLAIMSGSFEQTLEVYAAKYAKPPKEKKK
jgi:hypothetical protein